MHASHYEAQIRSALQQRVQNLRREPEVFNMLVVHRFNSVPLLRVQLRTVAKAATEVYYLSIELQI